MVHLAQCPREPMRTSPPAATASSKEANRCHPVAMSCLLIGARTEPCSSCSATAAATPTAPAPLIRVAAGEPVAWQVSSDLLRRHPKLSLFFVETQCSNSDPCCDGCAYTAARARKGDHLPLLRRGRPARHTHAPCDCLFAACRPAVDDCDLAEVCPGDSSRCPVDLVQPPGTPCTTAPGIGTVACHSRPSLTA